MQETIKTLIITSCTSEKKYSDADEVYAKDIYFSKYNVKEKALRSKDKCCNAYDMYIGKQYGPDKSGNLGPIKKAIELLKREHYDFDHYILSAGYGLIPSNKEIVPYDISFNYPTSLSRKYTDVRKQTPCKNYIEWANFLHVREDFDKLIKGYNLVIILLANNYTKVLNLKYNLNLKEGQKIIYVDNPKNSLPMSPSQFEIIDPTPLDNECYEPHGSPFNFKCRGHIFYHLVQCALENNKNVFEYFMETDLKTKIKDLNNICYKKNY